MKKRFLPLFVLPCLLAIGRPLQSAESDTLKERIQSRVADFSSKTPESTKAAYAAGIKAVADSRILKSAKQVGDKAPDFVLTDAGGESRSLSGLLKTGPVVLTWYRGGWCPYCNLTLIALQEVLPDIQAQGAQVVALTPELPDKVAETAKKNRTDFKILNDRNHLSAKQYGIVFKLTPEVRDLYRKHFNLEDFNGVEAGNEELPLAATYIIGQDGVIRYAFLNADYRERAEPAELVAFLKANRKILTEKP